MKWEYNSLEGSFTLCTGENKMTRKNYHPIFTNDRWQPGSHTKNEPGFMNDLTIQETRRECERLNTRSDAPDSMDIDSGLGIGGINNDQSMPVIPSLQAMERVQKMYDTDKICKRCGSSKNFDGAMFTTYGNGICDDCGG